VGATLDYYNVAHYGIYIFVSLYQSIFWKMSKALIVLTISSVIGLVLFCQFLYEIWDKEFEDRDKHNKGDFWY